eukprot:CAMPEP_0119361642 /NCGR_PEP_ID=MMETSP1334-20130426/8906_1 /TAXON_ID=127549 /ORGANISM="Calcidiscus leptoporus, Strain RCC1130" /LENGTH=298 /DNA_ID=CAMNT_0007376707 /DNA_START=84 /DNA_END=977 /DNA_ORIENTATION=-
MPLWGRHASAERDSSAVRRQRGADSRTQRNSEANNASRRSAHDSNGLDAGRRGAIGGPARVTEQALEMFAQLDADGDGEVSFVELQAALLTNPSFARLAGAGEAALSPIAAAAIAENLHQLMDHDFDGSVSVTEFVRLCRKLKREECSSGGSLAHRPHGSGAAPRPSERISASLRKLVVGKGEGFAESQLKALQSSLRWMVEQTERVLEAAQRASDVDERSRLYHEQLLLVVDRARAWSAENAFAVADGEESPEYELLRLRHDLAEAKVQLAEAASACDALRHKLQHATATKSDQRVW